MESMMSKTTQRGQLLIQRDGATPYPSRRFEAPTQVPRSGSAMLHPAVDVCSGPRPMCDARPKSSSVRLSSGEDIIREIQVKYTFAKLRTSQGWYGCRPPWPFPRLDCLDCGVSLEERHTPNATIFGSHTNSWPCWINKPSGRNV